MHEFQPWFNFMFLLKLSKTLDVNYVQKCQICVENENLEWKNTRQNADWLRNLEPEALKILYLRKSNYYLEVHNCTLRIWFIFFVPTLCLFEEPS